MESYVFLFSEGEEKSNFNQDGEFFSSVTSYLSRQKESKWNTKTFCVYCYLFFRKIIKSLWLSKNLKEHTCCWSPKLTITQVTYSSIFTQTQVRMADTFVYISTMCMVLKTILWSFWWPFTPHSWNKRYLFEQVGLRCTKNVINKKI